MGDLIFAMAVIALILLALIGGACAGMSAGTFITYWTRPKR